MNALSTKVDVASARHRSQPWQWFATVVAISVAAAIAWMFAANPAVEWETIIRYFLFPSILDGLVTTLWLTAAAMAIGIGGGVILAACRLSPNWLLRFIAGAYVWFFRGTPLMVQLIFWYNIAIFIPHVTIGIPFTDHMLVNSSTNDLINPLMAALLGLSLNEAAYMCEVVRGGLQSVSPGQAEAASSLGLSSRQSFTQIILPQAMRSIIPPTGNQVITLLKGTSLVSVMAVYDLFYSAEAIYTTNGKVIPLLIVACVWYLIITSVLYLLQSRIEKRFGRGFVRRTVQKNPPKAISTEEEVSR